MVQRELLVLRAAVLATVRRFFGERGYLEVETPIMVPSPGLDLHLDAVELASARGARYLITSPEYQMKRLLCAGFERIFQIGRCFRAGEVGQRHNPEFTMLEWYCARAGYRELMDETEQLVREVASMHRGGQLWADGADVDVSQPFARMTVAEAFERYAGVNRAEMLDMAARDEERFFRLMVERIEPALRERAAPVFLVDYPASQASLARSKPEDPSSCERFELYLGDVELCNGFGELCDAVEQRARLERDQRRRAELGKPVYPIDEKFLSDMAQGMPPCAGNALGLDRLVAAAAGVDAIGEVMAFPTDRV